METSFFAATLSNAALKRSERETGNLPLTRHILRRFTPVTQDGGFFYLSYNNLIFKRRFSFRVGLPWS